MMRKLLFEMFGLSEDGDDLATRSTRLSALKQIDNGVQPMENHPGSTGASLFKGSDASVWKVGIDDTLTVPGAKKLVRKTTETIVPVLDVRQLSNGEWAVKTSLMNPLPAGVEQRIYSAANGNSKDQEATEYVNKLSLELKEVGLDPADFYGKNNFMQDRNGKWRYIDIDIGIG